ncbi:MAG: hypothetical protein HY979_02155 [Candidatus Magasanikbacteria bacterium]|nr:hypothetical protein [Candidatus Magasanikbacteria bacterium]
MFFLRKNFISLSLIVIFLLSNFLVVTANAQTSTGFNDDINAQLGAAAGSGGAGFGAPQDPRLIVVTTIKILLGLLGTIFLCLTLYAGYLWMTAGGNEDDVTKAKTLLTQAVIGLIIILLSYSITIFVANTALGKGVVPGSYWGVQQVPLQNCNNGYCY